MTLKIDEANLFYRGEGWAESMAAASAAATKSIYCTALSLHAPTPNATGDWPELWRAWCAAARRGVVVELWLPAPMTHNAATRGNFTAGKAAVAAGIGINYVTGNRLLHAKTVVIDRRSVWIGSGNFTAAAAHHNHEAYLSVCCPRIAEELIARWEALR